MNNSKINLVPGSRSVNNNTSKSKTNKNKERFEMYIPDEEENGDEAEDINQFNPKQEETTAPEESMEKNNIESKKNQPTKKSSPNQVKGKIWNKLKNIF